MTNVQDYLRESHMPHIWCPGCGNGIVMGNIIRAIDELGLDRDKGVLRLSFVHYTSKAEVSKLIAALDRVLAE